jgi:hypothetical protein
MAATMVQSFRAALGWEPDFYGAGGNVRPFYLVARPGFWGGFGSFLDFFSPLEWNYPIYSGVDEATAISVYADWCLVGQDLAISTSRHLPAEALSA